MEAEIVFYTPFDNVLRATLTLSYRPMTTTDDHLEVNDLRCRSVFPGITESFFGPNFSSVLCLR